VDEATLVDVPRAGRFMRADRQARASERAPRLGGVLEPVNASPVSAKTDVLVGGQTGVL